MRFQKVASAAGMERSNCISLMDNGRIIRGASSYRNERYVPSTLVLRSIILLRSYLIPQQHFFEIRRAGQYQIRTLAAQLVLLSEPA
jgi:hypothetical protein